MTHGWVPKNYLLPVPINGWIEVVFRMAFMKTKVPPDQIWVDDFGKLGKPLLRLTEEVFGPDHGTRIGQDWRHFKELLLANMDRRHGQFTDVKREV